MMGLLALLVVGALGCGDDGGDGDGGDGGTSNGTTAAVDSGSPIHAVASLMRLEDSQGPYTEARLIIWTEATETAQFVDNASDVEVAFGGTTLQLPARPVDVGDERETMYFLTSRDSTLAYEPGATYTFSFVVTGRAAGDLDGQAFRLEVVAPEANNNLSTASSPELGSPLDLIPGQTYDAGILEVFRTQSDENTYISYPYAEQFLTGLDDLMTDHAALSKGGGSILTIPAEAFSRSGTHTVVHIGLVTHLPGSAQVSDNLGVHSIVYSGASAQVSVDIP